MQVSCALCNRSCCLSLPAPRNRQILLPVNTLIELGLASHSGGSKQHVQGNGTHIQGLRESAQMLLGCGRLSQGFSLQ